MKIAVCSQNGYPQASVDSRFGRTAFFAVYDDASQQWEFIENHTHFQAVQGAGIQAAQTIVDARADVLLACHVGPKAMTALEAGRIAVFKTGPAKTIQQALSEYKAGKLAPIQQANVEGHW